MNKIKLISCALSVMPVLAAIHVNAQTTDLVELTIPDVVIEKETVHFSQPITSNRKISLKAKGYTDISDEYWFETTGKQLKLGVNLAISNPGALIRLSGHQAKDKAAIKAKGIDPDSVQLFKSNKRLSTPFSQKVSQQEFASANIFPNSSAMKLKSELGKGEFTLKVNDYLEDNQRYIVNVKEKNAEHKLHLSLPKQSYMHGEEIDFTSQLKLTSTNTAMVTQGKSTAYIKSPTGEKEQLSFTANGSQFQFTLPTSLSSSKRGGLFELHIETENNTNGLKVKRNAKVAFAIAQPTARIEAAAGLNQSLDQDSLTIEKDSTNLQEILAASSIDIDLQVASEGRYEVSAMVYGSTGKKLSLPFMLSRSAYYLTPGEHKVQLKLDSNIIKNSELKAPYTIKNIRLMDQSRMALLQQM